MWIETLSVKMRNSRKRKDRNNPEVVMNREKRKEKIMKTDKKCTGFGMPNYFPETPESEDLHSIGNHISIMDKEHKKIKWDSRLIDCAMACTLHDRRSKIVTLHWTVSKIKELYPCLFDSKQVSVNKIFHPIMIK